MKIVPFLLIANVVIFIVQLTVQGFTDMFVLVSSTVAFEPWTLVTSMFLHGSLSHLFYNMFALFIFGLIMESTVGSERFIKIYFMAGILAGIASVFFYESVLGASGAIYGILGCLAILRPKMTVWVMGVPMPMIVALFFWALLDIGGVFYPSGVANIAHLAGLAIGIASGFILRTPSQEKKEEQPLQERQLDKWEERYM